MAGMPSRDCAPTPLPSVSTSGDTHAAHRGDRVGTGGLLHRRGCAEGVRRRACAVDIIDRLPVPFGLIRTGVAPDHQSIKAVSRRYEATALSDNVRFVGNVASAATCRSPNCSTCTTRWCWRPARPPTGRSGIPGDDLPGVIGSAAFVGWYNGHPDHAGLAPALDGGGAVIVGNGNVALDVARILAKAEDEFGGSDIVGHALDRLKRGHAGDITLLGRRGPHQIAMTPKELGELGHLVARAADRRSPPTCRRSRTTPRSIPASASRSTHLRDFAATPRGDKPIRIVFDFFAKPVAIEGDGRAERVIVERTALAAPTVGATAPARPMRSPPRWSSAASAIAPRRSRACRMTRRWAGSPTTRGGSRPGSTRSAGRGADRPARSAPTAPTASRSSRRSARIRADEFGQGGPRRAGRAAGGARRRRRHLPRLAADRRGRGRPRPRRRPAREIRRCRRRCSARVASG